MEQHRTQLIQISLRQAYLSEGDERLWGNSVANVLCSFQKVSSVTTGLAGLVLVAKGDVMPTIARGVCIPSHGTCGCDVWMGDPVARQRSPCRLYTSLQNYQCYCNAWQASKWKQDLRENRAWHLPHWKSLREAPPWPYRASIIGFLWRIFTQTYVHAYAAVDFPAADWIGVRTRQRR